MVFNLLILALLAVAVSTNLWAAAGYRSARRDYLRAREAYEQAHVSDERVIVAQRKLIQSLDRVNRKEWDRTELN